ncbi:hypothetical protein L6452_37092 [Arctium lappa]|uniref:Uncharacterized protein n=1 Tax=Arctium lappa TaxID=4217 RepID=A0ACB8Y225_ARCLA|nr:hypothetical protein L6452_37092 [Arctium lappa]
MPIFFATDCLYRENEVELLQRYRQDRQILFNYLLSGSLMKKVVMPRGAVSLDDMDLDQISVDYVLKSVKKALSRIRHLLHSLPLRLRLQIRHRLILRLRTGA